MDNYPIKSRNLIPIRFYLQSYKQCRGIEGAQITCAGNGCYVALPLNCKMQANPI
eukprot:UN13222